MGQNHWGWRLWRVLYPILLIWLVSYAVSTVGMFLLMMQMGMSGDLHQTENVMQEYLKNSVVYSGISSLILLPVLVFFYQRDKKYLVPVRYHTPAVWYFVVVIIGAAACFGLNGLLNMSGMTAEYAEQMEYLNLLLYSAPLWLQILCTGILAPLAEEMVFRGLVFKRMRTYLHFWPAAIASSLIFGIYHGNMLQLLYAGLLGLAMAFIYEQFRNILAPILFHVSANLLSVLISNIPELTQIFNGKNGTLYYMIATAVCVVTAVSLLWLMQLKMKTGEGQPSEASDSGNSLL